MNLDPVLIFARNYQKKFHIPQKFVHSSIIFFAFWNAAIIIYSHLGIIHYIAMLK